MVHYTIFVYIYNMCIHYLSIYLSLSIYIYITTIYMHSIYIYIYICIYMYVYIYIYAYLSLSLYIYIYIYIVSGLLEGRVEDGGRVPGVLPLQCCLWDFNSASHSLVSRSMFPATFAFEPFAHLPF